MGVIHVKQKHIPQRAERIILLVIINHGIKPTDFCRLKLPTLDFAFSSFLLCILSLKQATEGLSLHYFADFSMTYTIIHQSG